MLLSTVSLRNVSSWDTFLRKLKQLNISQRETYFRILFSVGDHIFTTVLLNLVCVGFHECLSTLLRAAVWFCCWFITFLCHIWLNVKCFKLIVVRICTMFTFHKVGTPSYSVTCRPISRHRVGLLYIHSEWCSLLRPLLKKGIQISVGTTILILAQFNNDNNNINDNNDNNNLLH